MRVAITRTVTNFSIPYFQEQIAWAICTRATLRA